MLSDTQEEHRFITHNNKVIKYLEIVCQVTFCLNIVIVWIWCVPHQRLVWNSSPQPMVCYWGASSNLKRRVYLEKMSHKGRPLEGLGLLLVSFSLLPVWHKVKISSVSCSWPHDVLLGSLGPSDHSPQKPWAKITHYFFKLVVLGIPSVQQKTLQCISMHNDGKGFMAWPLNSSILGF